ncbi:MAG: tetratricopeptide repeat protein [Myxococcota bacterium]|nr:tetratricopeptide repeat protein [Myxococcota bacterium]
MSDNKISEQTERPIDPNADEEHLAELGPRFMAAMALRRQGRDDQAIKELRGILAVEPRLPEPRLELGRIYLDMGRLADAREETEEALRVLEAGGQWVEDIPPEVMFSTAHGQLAETLRQLADSDEVIFGDPEVFKALLAKAKVHFAKAQDFDPNNEHASFYAFHVGVGDEVSFAGEAEGEAAALAALQALGEE